MTEYAKNAGNSGAEEKFVQIFCDVFGAEKGQYVYLQFPFDDIYGGHRTIDFAIQTDEGRIAFEIDGETWHNPEKVSQGKYIDDLLKQNSLVYQGWKIYRWTDSQIEKTPDRVKDELVTFLGFSPALTYIDTTSANQKGVVFELRENQKEALENLQKMRDEGKTIALVQGATGSGKSAIGVLDAQKVGKRVLFLAHTKELVEQGAENFESLWKDATIGRFYDKFQQTDAFVVCASIQSVIRNLDLFQPDDFGYLIIDECHHASAKSYTKILSYFRPSFTLGLTATPERADGEDLLEVFQNVAHKLDIKDAVEAGVLCPVRCIRVKTNIDLSDVRINGFKYNSQDLEQTIMVPGRNELIVQTYLDYVKGKSTVIFCTSVVHADTIAEMLRDNGVKAESVSGKTENSRRKEILEEYAEKKIQVLCAEYVPGGMVLGTKHGMKWDMDMFHKGEKPSYLLDYPIHATDYEIIDLFNWQEQANKMYSTLELTRHVSAQSETIEKYIREGKIKADLEVPVSEHKTLHYFNKERVKEFCKKFRWTEITANNRKKLFIDYCSQMTMSKSYKPVFLISFLGCMNHKGEAKLEEVADSFAKYYEKRRAEGLQVEKGNCLFTKTGYTQKQVQRLILTNPFKRFEDMGYMHHSKYLGILQIDKSIMKDFDDEDMSQILDFCTSALERYWKN